jgi:SAM-dependent methyltransferase
LRTLDGITTKFSAPITDFHGLKDVGPSEPLLDIGSGYGRVLDYLLDRGFVNVFGLEPSMKFLKKGDHPVVCGRGEQAPFRDECFGAVFLIGVLSYILEDSKRHKLFETAHRILKNRGLFFLSCFLISENDYHQKKYLEGQKKHKKYGIFESDSGGIFRHADEEELRELLKNFEILRWKPHPFTTMNRRPASGVIIEAQKT